MTLQVEDDTRRLTFSNKKSKWQEVNKEVDNLLRGKKRERRDPEGENNPLGSLGNVPSPFSLHYRNI